MYCPKCGADNPEGSIFCGDCGAPLAEGEPQLEAPASPAAAEGPVRCSHCGADNAAGAVFCSTCRGVLSAPSAGAPSGIEPRSADEEKLPKRCPSCGGPVYLGQARCRRCGADPVAEAHFESQMEPKDARGPILYEEQPLNKRGELRRPDLWDVIEAFLGPFLRR